MLVAIAAIAFGARVERRAESAPAIAHAASSYAMVHAVRVHPVLHRLSDERERRTDAGSGFPPHAALPPQHHDARLASSPITGVLAEFRARATLVRHALARRPEARAPPSRR
jgi:hypothetical protein